MLLQPSRAMHPCVWTYPLPSHSRETTQGTCKDSCRAPVYHQISPTYRRSHPLTLHLQCHRCRCRRIAQNIPLRSTKNITIPWPLPVTLHTHYEDHPSQRKSKSPLRMFTIPRISSRRKKHTTVQAQVCLGKIPYLREGSQPCTDTEEVVLFCDGKVLWTGSRFCSLWGALVPSVLELKGSPDDACLTPSRLTLARQWQWYSLLSPAVACPRDDMSVIHIRSFSFYTLWYQMV